MTDLDLTRYEGHTPGPWKVTGHIHDCAIVQAATAKPGWSDDPGPRMNSAAMVLIADAPLLLAEVRRLREENEQQRKTIERYAQWDAQRQRNVDLAAQLAALRRSHARLLKELYLQRERWVLLKQVPDDPADQAVCAIRNLDAAVAEAEALNG